MKKKKNIILLSAGLLLFVVGILLCYKTYHSSYAESLETGTALSQIKTEISDTEKLLNETNEEETRQTLEKTLADLKKNKETLSEEKLSQEKPYSYSLIVLFLGVLLTIVGIVKLTSKDTNNAKTNLTRLTQAGLLAALCYIGFTFFKIDIPVGTEKTAFHLGNVFCVLASLLLGGFWGGLSGAVGMTIADLTTAYATSAPKTFLLKFCIGLIVGLVAHKIFKLGKNSNKKHITWITILASVCGMGFNIIADPLVGYFYKTYLLGIPQDLSAALAKVAAITTFVNAIIAVFAATIFYLALRPALKKAGLLVTEYRDSF